MKRELRRLREEFGGRDQMGGRETTRKMKNIREKGEKISQRERERDNINIQFIPSFSIL